MSLSSASRSARRLLARTALAFCMFCGLASVGCAARLTPPPIVTKAQLGKVVIYRNGVAYFERRAAPGERELELSVPAERVDDFLKSLSIVDETTSEALPVSYPTLKHDGAMVKMTIQLPERNGGLKITYVTESPSWKPSYRLFVKKDGRARLQSWAIVDNVSGEAWKDVRVGVGSTSALSFRYDLHSVRLVERATLMSQDMLAIAPPTGGSPFAAPKDLREAANAAAKELAKLDEEELDDNKRKNEDKPREVAGEARLGGLGDDGDGGLAWGRGARMGKATAAATPPPPPQPAVPFRKPMNRPPPRPVADPRPSPTQASTRARALARQTASMLSGNQRLRIEGFAQKGDSQPERSALERANKVRNRLIAEGVPADRIDAVGVNQLNDEPVVVAVTEEEGKRAAATGATEAPTAEPTGQALFVSSETMTIAADHSAMVSIMQSDADAERVYYYDPISARGSKDFAFNAIRLTNPSDYMLDSGPFSIYSDGQFLGEGLSEPVLPKGTTFIPYALDRSLLVETEPGSREEIEKLVTAQRGIVSCEARRVRTTKLTVTNRGIEPATVFVRHQTLSGYELISDKKLEKLGGAYLFPVKVAAGSSIDLVIEEKTPMKKTIDINSDSGIREVKLFLEKGRISDDLAAGLQRIVAQHEQAADVKQRIETLDEQMRVLRTRVDEINFQLVTLKKLPQGERLRTHLSDRMQEISDRLQKATLERAELDGKLMTTRIELQDAVADLTIDKQENKAAPIKIGAKP